MPRTRLITGAVLGDAAERWQLPSVETPLLEEMVHTPPPADPVIEPVPHWPTAEEIAALHQQAYEEGLALGRKEGYTQAYDETRAEWTARGQELQSIITFLQNPLEELTPMLETQTVELVVLIARQLIRRELKTSPDEIVAVVREAMSQLPLAAQHPRIHLHPEDVDIVKSALGLQDGPQGWLVQADPRLTRGGCRVESQASRIDATLEARLNATIAQFFGRDRASDVIA